MANAQVTERPAARGPREPHNGRRPKVKPLPHFTAPQREAAGKAARARVPGSAHGVWELAPDRRDPVELMGHAPPSINARTATRTVCWK